MTHPDDARLRGHDQRAGTPGARSNRIVHSNAEEVMSVRDELTKWRAARKLSRPVVLSLMLAVGMTWPLVLHLGSDIPQDLGDPVLNAWHVAWIGHALREQPLDLFQANTFWPESDSLAFADVLLGYAPAGIVAAQGVWAALVVYNVLFLFSYVLAFIGAYFLACELGARRAAAVIAGAAFAYAPYRLAQDGHLQVISSGGIPLALFLLVRGYRRRSARLVLAGWLVTTWQVTLGFTLGVQLVYLVVAIGGVAALYWLRRGRHHIGRAVLGASVAGLGVLCFVTFLQARPYFRVVEDHPEASRTPELVTLYSPPVRSFLAASQEGFLWAGPTARVWDSLAVPGEQALFPGIAILVLASLGLISPAYPRALRYWLGVGTIVCALLSLGLRGESHATGGFMPYRLLYEFGPGWDGFRAPGRIHTLTSLGLALLAAAGAALILREIRTRPVIGTSSQVAARGKWAALLTAGILGSLVLLEGLGPTRHPQVPGAPIAQIESRSPQLHLPSEDGIDGLYAYWSIAGFPKLANGYGSFVPSQLRHIRRVTANFPDASSVAFLRDLGVRTVVLHPDLAVGTRWQDAARHPTRGLPVIREDRDGIVLYHLDPAAGAP